MLLVCRVGRGKDALSTTAVLLPILAGWAGFKARTASIKAQAPLCKLVRWRYGPYWTLDIWARPAELFSYQAAQVTWAEEEPLLIHGFHGA